MNEFLKRFGRTNTDQTRPTFEPDAVAILQDEYGYELYFYTLQSVREFLSNPKHSNYKIIRPRTALTKLKRKSPNHIRGITTKK